MQDGARSGADLSVLAERSMHGYGGGPEAKLMPGPEGVRHSPDEMRPHAVRGSQSRHLGGRRCAALAAIPHGLGAQGGTGRQEHARQMQPQRVRAVPEAGARPCRVGHSLERSGDSPALAEVRWSRCIPAFRLLGLQRPRNCRVIEGCFRGECESSAPNIGKAGRPELHMRTGGLQRRAHAPHGGGPCAELAVRSLAASRLRPRAKARLCSRPS
mmetsp:Transcript_94600/g.294697  ORF Transcript_94600/g.294697 Transcript_94600/m.294697 type:complete len:214 (-) Transcript_94600:354-995(-)